MSQAKMIETLGACEAERCAALIAEDVRRLRHVLDRELVHVHTNGTVEDLETYLDTALARLRFLEITRDPPPHIRIHRDTAIMTGPIAQRIEIRATGEVVSMRAYVTQLWIRAGVAWRLASFHATKIAG